MLVQSLSLLSFSPCNQRSKRVIAPSEQAVMPKSSAKSLSSERLAAAGNALLSKTRRASTLPKIAAAQRTRSPKSRVPLSTSLSQQRLNVVKESTNQQELTSTSSSPSTDQSTTKASFLNGNLEQSSLSHRDELVKENARPSTDVPKPFVENCQIDPMLQGVNATSYRLLTRPIAGGATGATRHSNISNCNNSDSSNFAFLSSPSRASVAVSSSTSVVGVVTRANRHRAAKERQPQSGVESGRYHKRARHASELEMKASPARASVPTRSTPITVAFLKQFLGMDEEKLQQTFFFNGRDSDPVGKVPKSQHGEWQDLPIRRDCFNALNAAQGDDNKKKLGVDVVMAFCRTVIYHHNRQYPNAPAHVFGPELMRSLFEGGDTFVYDADNDRPTCLPGEFYSQVVVSLTEGRH